MITSPIAVYGIPRSGFSLTISTLYKLGLFEKKQLFTLENIDKELGNLIYSPITTILKKNFFDEEITLSGEFKSLTGGPKQLIDDKLWIRKYIGLGKLGDITLSIKVPKIFGILCPIYHSHCPDDSISSRSSNIFTYRHPCGIYESSINSFNALTSKYLQKFTHSNVSEEKMRRQLALHKICDHTIRNSMLNYLSDNMREYSYYHENYQENIYDFSWEGFISKNESNINNFRNILLNFGIEKSSREILNVMESSRYKNLLNYHKHNYRPGHALISGWITELPFQILREIKDLESFNGYIKILNETYQKDLTLIVDSLASSKFKRLASSILEKKLSLKINIDPLLKEYALNKTNVDQNCFKDTHITNTDLGFIYIHRMTKNCEKYLNIFKKFSAKLEKISNSIESNSKNLDFQNIYKSYPDLQKPIDLALDLKNEISKILKS